MSEQIKAGDTVSFLEDLKRAESAVGADGKPNGPETHGVSSVTHNVRKYVVQYVANGSARVKRGDHEASVDLDKLRLVLPD